MANLVRILIAAGSALAAVAPAAGAASSLDYTIIMSGRVKGGMTVTDDAGGVRRVAWQYDDRGRGPNLVETRAVDAKGVPVALAVDGTDYRKHRIAERFEAAGGGATWHSDADDGQGKTGGFYVPSQSNDEDLAAAARAALVAGGSIAVLPSGSMRIEKAAEKDVVRDGQRVHATLYLLYGLELSPAGVWLDERNQLFAAGGAFLGTIRKGFEEDQPALLAAEAAVRRTRLAALVKALRHRPTGPVAFRHVRLFDAERRRVEIGMTVLVDRGRIVRVGRDGSVRVPAEAEVIEGRGKTLIPGLWNMHVHLLDETEGLTDLFAGVTTVRDMGNDDARVVHIQNLFDAGTMPGPHVLKALLIDGTGPLTAPLGVTADTPEEVKREIDAAPAKGFVQVKLYSSFKPALVPLAVAEAHRNGLRISGHVPAGMSMRDVVADGYDEVQHAYFWLLNFMPPDIQARTNSPTRFTDAGEHGWEIDPDSDRVRTFIRYVADHHVVLDPTFVAFETMFVGERGKPAAWLAPWADRMPVGELRSSMAGGRGITPRLKAEYTGSYARARQMLMRFWKAGVRIVPGTDDSSLLYSRELENYVEAGIPVRDVLYLATLGSARVMKRDRDSGSIAPGKIADLVLIDGDPIARIGDVRRTVIVMKGGTLFDADKLGAAIGLGPRRR
ncbi:MAG TPA: amidohydrolase family protein [Allosphingosinicella sp.]|nr:amidohydrolase family protein [Allosphingosinicella sp.]